MTQITKKYEPKVYLAGECCFFSKTKEKFGGLSNMAGGFPLNVNGIAIKSSEALYQACRFPHLPDIQVQILSEKSPMTAKMVSKPYREQTRPDWENEKVRIMRWCLKVKLAQNYWLFGKVLEETFDRTIVEESNKDPFWGAIRNKKNKDEFVGVNALGRLLMELRQQYYEKRYDAAMFVVPPLQIPNFELMGQPIAVIDSREYFSQFVRTSLHLRVKNEDFPSEENVIAPPVVLVKKQPKKKPIKSETIHRGEQGSLLL